MHARAVWSRLALPRTAAACRTPTLTSTLASTTASFQEQPRRWFAWNGNNGPDETPSVLLSSDEEDDDFDPTTTSPPKETAKLLNRLYTLGEEEWDPSMRSFPRAKPLWMAFADEEEFQASNMRPAQKDSGDSGKESMAFIKVPMRDEKGRAYSTGRRKTSAARVWVKAGDGTIKVNGKSIVEYFPRIAHRLHVIEPFVATNSMGAFDVMVTVRGGGKSGQAGAIRHGLANAVARYDPYLRSLLKLHGLLTRDPRMVERKKPGQKKARKKFQWVKR